MKLNFTSLLYFQRTAEMQHLTNAAESLCRPAGPLQNDQRHRERTGCRTV